MSLQYVGLHEVNGPLIFLDHVLDASYEEMVEIKCSDGTTRLGKVVQLEGDKAAIQVFEGTNGLSLKNTRTKFTGRPMELALSKEILGRTFNGSGQPIDGLGEIYAEKSMDINGQPLNPVSRVYPRNYINTGISSIDSFEAVSHRGTLWRQGAGTGRQCVPCVPRQRAGIGEQKIPVLWRCGKPGCGGSGTRRELVEGRNAFGGGIRLL